MIEITDQAMQETLAKARPYWVVLLQPGPAYESPAKRTPEKAATVREHGRRNLSLRAGGEIALVGPAAAPGGPFLGLIVFTTGEAETAALMDADPAVAAGIFTYQMAEWFGFPGDGLPEGQD